jgi:hypothetical protein
MTMTLSRTHLHPPVSSALEALYPREGFVRMPDGSSKPIFLGHPKASCVECEFPLSDKRRHPNSTDVAGVVVVCGGHLMRLISGRPE